MGMDDEFDDLLQLSKNRFATRGGEPVVSSPLQEWKKEALRSTKIDYKRAIQTIVDIQRG